MTRHLLLAAAVLLNSCSVSGPYAPLNITVIEEAGGGEEQPFSLSLLHEFNDGENIYVAGTVTPRGPWPAGSVNLKFSGLHSGEPAGERLVTLAELAHLDSATPLTLGQPVPFSFSIPATGLSDYTLELAWAGAQGPKTHQVTVDASELQRRPATCDLEPCPELYRIMTKIHNRSPQARSEIVLGIGLVWAREGQMLDLSKTIPENEQKVTLAGVVLRPGEEKLLKLNLPDVIPQAPGGRYLPLVRILSAQ